MEFFSLLISSEYLVFTFSLGIAAVLALLSVFGLDFDDDVDVDIDIEDFETQGFILDYLGFGKVPALITLTCLLGSFAFAGFAINIAFASIGFTISWVLSAPLAIIPSAFVTRKLVNFIAKNLPNYESYASSLEDFVGSEALVTIGASAGRIGEAKLVDSVNTTHYIRVKFTKQKKVGEKVILSDYDLNTKCFIA